MLQLRHFLKLCLCHFAYKQGSEWEWVELEIKQNDLAAVGCQAVFFANILNHHDENDDIDEATTVLNAFKHEEVSEPSKQKRDASQGTRNLNHIMTIWIVTQFFEIRTWKNKIKLKNQMLKANSIFKKHNQAPISNFVKQKQTRLKQQNIETTSSF